MNCNFSIPDPKKKMGPVTGFEGIKIVLKKNRTNYCNRVVSFAMRMVFVWHYFWFSVRGSHLPGSPESSTFSQASCLCVTSMIYKYRRLWSRTASSGRRARHIDPSCSIKLLLRLISHSQVNNSLY